MIYLFGDNVHQSVTALKGLTNEVDSEHWSFHYNDLLRNLIQVNTRTQVFQQEFWLQQDD